jgi:hypothetical protein
MDLLLPSTDAGVLVQVVGWVVVSGLGLYLTRNNKDLRLLVVGISILVLALMALRAVH